VPNDLTARGKPVKITRKDVLIAIIIYVVLSSGTHRTEAGQDSPPLSSAQIMQILSSPDRTTADRTNDLRRKPEQMLGFIGIRPGIVALDLSAAGGYTTELLARSIGPTGKVYGQSRPRDPNQTPTSSSVPEGNSRPNLAPVATPAARHRPHRGRLRSHWPIARLGSTRPAFRPRRSSLSPGPSRIPFLRSWRSRLIW